MTDVDRGSSWRWRLALVRDTARSIGPCRWRARGSQKKALIAAGDDQGGACIAHSAGWCPPGGPRPHNGRSATLTSSSFKCGPGCLPPSPHTQPFSLPPSWPAASACCSCGLPSAILARKWQYRGTAGAAAKSATCVVPAHHLLHARLESRRASLDVEGQREEGCIQDTRSPRNGGIGGRSRGLDDSRGLASKLRLLPPLKVGSSGSSESSIDKRSVASHESCRVRPCAKERDRLAERTQICAALASATRRQGLNSIRKTRWWRLRPWRKFRPGSRSHNSGELQCARIADRSECP